MTTTPPKKKKLLQLKNKNIKCLDDNRIKDKNKTLIGIVPILINILASITIHRKLSRAAESFLTKVLDAFDETYEKPTALRAAGFKIINTCNYPKFLRN